MNRDEIERSLRQPGPREAGYLPSALPMSVDAPRPRAGGRRLLAVARVGILTAAVVAGAVIALVLTRGTASLPGDNGTGAGSSAPSAVSTEPAVASGSPAPVGACHAEDFAWSTDPWGGAAGSRGTTVLLRIVTSLAGCEISGSASLVLSDVSGQVLLSAQAPASEVTVQAETVLQVGISWSNWCGSPPAGPLSLTLTLPDDTQKIPLVPATGEILVPPCSGTGQPSVLNATEFQPSDRPPPEG